MQVVLTDWDGLFGEAIAQPGELQQMLARLQGLGVPVVVFTQRDRAELEPLREQLAWQDPFITESGSALFLPVDPPLFDQAIGEREGNYYVVEFGCPYVQARAGLRVLANVVAHPLKGFGDFTVPQLQKFLGVSEDEAHRAKAREYSEPFMTPKAVAASVLEAGAAEMGFAVVSRGAEASRFSELVGAGAGLSAAIRQVLAAYQQRQSEGEGLRAIALSHPSQPLSDVTDALSEDALSEMADLDWTVATAETDSEWVAAVENWLA
jgi:mannosyl-3-phosphoglycerate phosphatase